MPGVAAALGVVRPRPARERREQAGLHRRHWLEEIEGDPAALTRAAAQASRVTDYVLSISRPSAAETAVA